ncbi:hypothetical protein ACZ91_41765 [Streptomyces regensis]|nr:hypothetical protein ACZ91_41765 [Streptomyces regensis]
MVTGFEVERDPLTAFREHLGELESDLKDTAEMVGGCVGDVGLWGVIGQAFGTIVIESCQKMQSQFNDYGDTIGRFSEGVKEAADRYEQGDEDAVEALLRFKV